EERRRELDDLVVGAAVDAAARLPDGLARRRAERAEDVHVVRVPAGRGRGRQAVAQLRHRLAQALDQLEGGRLAPGRGDVVEVLDRAAAARAEAGERVDEHAVLRVAAAMVPRVLARRRIVLERAHELPELVVEDAVLEDLAPALVE